MAREIAILVHNVRVIRANRLRPAIEYCYFQCPENRFAENQKKPRVRNFSGAGNGRANFMRAWAFFLGSFCRKTPMPRKIPPFIGCEKSAQSFLA